MKASNISDAQKAFILKQGDDGVPVAEICRKAGISEATCFNWRKKYAGLLPDGKLQLPPIQRWGSVQLHNSITESLAVTCLLST